MSIVAGTLWPEMLRAAAYAIEWRWLRGEREIPKGEATAAHVALVREAVAYFARWSSILGEVISHADADPMVVARIRAHMPPTEGADGVDWLWSFVHEGVTLAHREATRRRGLPRA